MCINYGSDYDYSYYIYKLWIINLKIVLKVLFQFGASLTILWKSVCAWAYSKHWILVSSQCTSSICREMFRKMTSSQDTCEILQSALWCLSVCPYRRTGTTPPPPHDGFYCELILELALKISVQFSYSLKRTKFRVHFAWSCLYILNTLVTWFAGCWFYAFPIYIGCQGHLCCEEAGNISNHM